MGAFALPPELPYAGFRTLSTEARQKLAALRPASLAQAGRVPGVSPNDLQNLVFEVERWRRAAPPAAPVSPTGTS
jgi:tRNA uridine 5-carboxymethylaminomethyl modification enzyme